MEIEFTRKGPMQLSEQVKALIKKARIVAVPQLSASHAQIFQAADDEGRYLTDADLVVLQSQSDRLGLDVAQQLRDQAADIVDEARCDVLAAFPHILEPGGGLYPPVRAQACWRDFWHFLRCISYGIAAQVPDYTSGTGLGYMQDLYRELQVPLEAMVLGLEGIKAASLRRIDPAHQTALAPYFDHLIERLRQFSHD